MRNSDQITGQLPYLQDQKSLSLRWCSFKYIVHSKPAAINNWIDNCLNLLAAFLPDGDSALWEHWANKYSCICRSNSSKIYTSCLIIHFAHYTAVYYPILTCDGSIFSHNISCNEILSQTTWRIGWKYVDAISPTFSSSPDSSSFPLGWP